jgi:hypothetical protein
MQPHKPRAVTLEWNRPHPVDLTIAAALYYLLHLQPQVHEAVAALIALAALRCVGIKRD